MRAITYLNGGALVAIPAAVALFKADPENAKYDLIFAGLLFVAGLLAIVIAQASAFFVLARREEAERFLAQRQIVLLASEHYPGTPDVQAQRTRSLVVAGLDILRCGLLFWRASNSQRMSSVGLNPKGQSLAISQR
jgi:hypothetical protein